MSCGHDGCTCAHEDQQAAVHEHDARHHGPSGCCGGSGRVEFDARLPEPHGDQDR